MPGETSAVNGRGGGARGDAAEYAAKLAEAGVLGEVLNPLHGWPAVLESAMRNTLPRL